MLCPLETELLLLKQLEHFLDSESGGLSDEVENENNKNDRTEVAVAAMDEFRAEFTRVSGFLEKLHHIYLEKESNDEEGNKEQNAQLISEKISQLDQHLASASMSKWEAKDILEKLASPLTDAIGVCRQHAAPVDPEADPQSNLKDAVIKTVREEFGC
ncbi:hypothetical protein AAVH_03823 [Aphelenchoides avenae]|nr:hypothetical protein AAVH_03823 [Aphelenchus avenae]